MADIVGTFRRGDGREGWPDRRPPASHRARGDGPQARFEFGKDLFAGIKVGAGGGQVKQLRAGSLNRLAAPGHFMTGQIVQDAPVARLEGRGEDLCDIRHKGGAIERAVEDGGGGKLVGAECRNDGGRLPMAGGDFRHEARAATTPTIPACHLRLERGLV